MSEEGIGIIDDANEEREKEYTPLPKKLAKLIEDDGGIQADTRTMALPHYAGTGLWKAF